MTDFATSTFTENATVVAGAKLPDDILLGELAELVSALADLDSAARDLAGERGIAHPGQPLDFVPRDAVMKLQYGSDFLVILSVTSSAIGIWVAFTKGLDFAASAFEKFQGGLGTREERLRLKRKRELVDEKWAKEVERLTRGDPRILVSKDNDSTLPRHERQELEELLPPKARTKKNLRALESLAEYGVQIRVEGD